MTRKSKRVLPSTTFRRKSGAGYTLLELLVVAAVAGLLFSFTYASYREFARNQTLLATARAVKGDLRLAQNKALDGKKPTGCVVLQGYQFNRLSPTSYTIEAVCSNATYTVKTENSIFEDTTMGLPSPNPILFKVLGKGTNIAEGSSATISLTMTGIAGAEVVTVSSAGEIK